MPRRRSSPRANGPMPRCSRWQDEWNLRRKRCDNSGLSVELPLVCAGSWTGASSSALDSFPNSAGPDKRSWCDWSDQCVGAGRDIPVPDPHRAALTFRAGNSPHWGSGASRVRPGRLRDRHETQRGGTAGHVAVGLRGPLYGRTFAPVVERRIGPQAQTVARAWGRDEDSVREAFAEAHADELRISSLNSEAGTAREYPLRPGLDVTREWIASRRQKSGIDSTHLARQAGGVNGSAKYWVSWATLPSRNSIMLIVDTAFPS